MKKTVLLSIILVTLSIIATAALPGTEGLSVSAEKARLNDLDLAYTDSGNAAELYLPYLDGSAEITKEDWLDNLGFDMIFDPAEGDEKTLEEAVKKADTDIDNILNGSRRAEYQLWVEYFNPQKDKLILMEEGIPQYHNMTRLGILTAARGDQLQRQGKLKPALDHYLALVRMGNHMESEPYLYGYLTGTLLKQKGSILVAQCLEEMGKKEKAEKWLEYNQAQGKRHEAMKYFADNTSKWEEEQCVDFIKDGDMPYAHKLELLANKHYCVYSKYMFVRCNLIGPPGWVEDLEEEFAKQDELSAAFVEQIQNNKASLDLLPLVGAIE